MNRSHTDPLGRARWEHGELVALVASAPVITPEAERGDTLPADRTPVDTVLDPPENGVPFSIPVVLLEGWETSDGRYIEPGVLGRRSLPQTLMAMRRNPDGGWGHDAAIIGGRIDTLERYDASSVINTETGEAYGAGVFAWRATGWLVQDTPDTVSTVAYIRDGVLRGVSADLGELQGEEEVLEVDEDGFPTRVRLRVTSGSIAQATACPFAAFPGAYIVLDEQAPEAPAPVDGEAVDTSAATLSNRELAAVGTLAPLARHGQPGALRVTGDDGCTPCETGRPALTASGGPEAPPAAWFADPQFTDYTPIVVTEDGRYYGHLAPWDTCHTGVGSACITAPRNGQDGYRLFHSGAVLTAEGTEVPVGHITLGGGHASTEPGVGVAGALAHYDDAGTAVADVAAGEDQWGIWVAGAVRPEATPQQVRQLRAHALSGDWRRDARGGPLLLVAALCVNTPGFPVPRSSARVAGGAPQAMVAAGATVAAARTRAALAASGGLTQEQVDARMAAMLREDRRGRAALARLLTR